MRIPAFLRAAWLPYAVLFGFLFISYQWGYLNYSHVPGNNPAYPLGWRGWADQGEYFRAVEDLAMRRFDASAHFYPPMYALIGSVFFRAAPHHPFYFPDLLILMGYAAIFVALAKRYIGIWSAVAVMIAGLTPLKMIGVQWLIPWTSTPAALMFIAGFYLLDRYLRNRNDLAWGLGERRWNALLFGVLHRLSHPDQAG